MRVLDLFSGAGGAAMGIHQALTEAGIDHEIVGVDVRPMARYPFAFHQGDALDFPLDGFDFVWASPPCQGYSIMHNLPWLRDREYPLLIPAIRDRLQLWGGPWVIENVMGAQRKADMGAAWLCGGMFGLPFYRHRAFQTNWPWLQPAHPRHTAVIRAGRMLGGHADPARGPLHSLAAWQRGNGVEKPGVGVGHAAGWREAAAAMGIDWMDREGLTQAVPPAYSKYILAAWAAQQGTEVAA